MTRAAAVLGVALWAACGTPSPPAQPTISVEKIDQVAKCAAACPGDGPPAAGLPVFMQCASPATACGFFGGADRGYVVVDYGAPQFAANAKLTPPTVTLVLDGVEGPIPGGVFAAPLDDGHAVFTVEFPIPNQLVKALGVHAVGGDGFQALVTNLDIALPMITAVAGGACTPANHCSAGVGNATFLIDAPIGLAPATAKLSSRLNSVPQQQVTSADLKLNADGTFLEGTATLPVPPSNGLRTGSSDAWLVDVTVGSSLTTLPLTLDDPMPTVLIGGNCTPAGTGFWSVGTAQLTIDAPFGITPATAQLSSTLNGVLQPVTASVTLAQKGSQVEGVALLPVPPTNGLHAPGQPDVWNIDLLIGTTPKRVTILLSDPMDSVTLTASGFCTADFTCKQDVGALTLTIDAPNGITPSTAVLSATVNGVPQPPVPAVPLTVKTGSIVEGVATLTVPVSNGFRSGAEDIWQIDVAIGTTHKPATLRLSDPAVSAVVTNCLGAADGGTTCALKAGSVATVVVTVPGDINETQATVSTQVGQVPQGDAVTRSFGPVQQQQRTALFLVQVPNQANALWTVSAQVGRLPATAASVLITP